MKTTIYNISNLTVKRAVNKDAMIPIQKTWSEGTKFISSERFRTYIITSIIFQVQNVVWECLRVFNQLKKGISGEQMKHYLLWLVGKTVSHLHNNGMKLWFLWGSQVEACKDKIIKTWV